MEQSFIEKVDQIKAALGKTLVHDDDILMLAADEISRTTTFNEQHSKNAAIAANQQ